MPLRRGSRGENDVTQPLTAEQILVNVRELAPEIAARATEAAALRRLPRDLVDKLKAAGCFRVMFPKSWGGPEMPLPLQLEMIEVLAHADTAVAWCVKIGSDSGLFAAWLADSPAHELYPDIDRVTAGQAPPNGRARKVAGGYRVTGRWGFGSGCTHADVMLGGCIVDDGAPQAPGSVPQVIHVLAPADGWRIEDTWFATGLAGSGSHHYSAENLFVPESHALDLFAPSGRDEPLYRLPITASVSVPMAGVPLGLARRAIDELVALAGKRIVALPPPPVLLKNLPRVRLAVARAESLLGAARAYVYETVHRLWDEVERAGVAAAATRRDVGLARIHAHRMACEVAQLMFDTAGPAAVYASSPLDRLLRDAVTINQHLLFNDGILEELGAMVLGDEVATRFV
jgi:alkylation response protein AidB-like acyl-CoA dehydrogenase